MKNKSSLLLVALAALFASNVAFAAAPEGAGKPAKDGAQQETKKDKSLKQGDESQVAANTDDASKQPKEKKEKAPKQSTSEKTKSTVATFVQSLLAVADREGGIGQEVRAVAQSQNDIKDRQGDLINAVEGRNKFKTFLIGTSYKNVGELRSQMVKTRNDIDKLRKLSEKAETDQDKAELNAQIQELEKQQETLDNFIAKNENKFSLFGWAVKLFRK